MYCPASGSAGKTPSGSGAVDSKKKEKEPIDEDGEPGAHGESTEEDDWGFTEVRKKYIFKLSFEHSLG